MYVAGYGIEYQHMLLTLKLGLTAWQHAAEHVK